MRELRDPGRKLWVLLGSIEAIDANDPLEIDERPEVPRAEFRLPLRLSRLALAGSSSGVLRLTSGVLRFTSGVLRFILCGRNHAWTLRRPAEPPSLNAHTADVWAVRSKCMTRVGRGVHFRRLPT